MLNYFQFNFFSFKLIICFTTIIILNNSMYLFILVSEIKLHLIFNYFPP